MYAWTKGLLLPGLATNCPACPPCHTVAPLRRYKSIIEPSMQAVGVCLSSEFYSSRFIVCNSRVSSDENRCPPTVAKVGNVYNGKKK
ncbi:hypothetical protein CEXT_197721 [Caerostris extrusa]|uniref:Secreted protein n=1 Tax=Caerostris extrusa TaxID=172846 RepID=A0AAV4US09_CAEEX|nr:hypothetical protein CEXT_197721 [Caerostris extrusa]